MKTAMILLVLGMLLVGMVPTAVSNAPWTEENGDDQNLGEQGHGPIDDEDQYEEEAQNGEELQNDGPLENGGGEPQNELDG